MKLKKLMNVYPIKIIENIIQLDVGQRGINLQYDDNLCSRTENNLLNSSRKIMEKPGTTVGIVTGFFIPHGEPPAPETDGPIGALALARGLNSLGYKVLLISDSLCIQPLAAGVKFFSEQLKGTELIEFPFDSDDLDNDEQTTNKLQYTKKTIDFVNRFYQKYTALEFLISIERVGPCHTLFSFLKQQKKGSFIDQTAFKTYGPGELFNQCLNMRGESVAAYTAKLYHLFEYIHYKNLSINTIGIGDGGNEIGMGSIPWNVIHQNIINGLGGKVACRIPTDFTIVSGVSNWAGYALIAAICCLLKKQFLFLELFSEKSETEFLQHLTEQKLAIDGVLGYPNLSVDGIDWEVHLAILKFIKNILIN